jgi:hypothetical protein
MLAETLAQLEYIDNTINGCIELLIVMISAIEKENPLAF